MLALAVTVVAVTMAVAAAAASVVVAVAAVRRSPRRCNGAGAMVVSAVGRLGAWQVR